MNPDASSSNRYGTRSLNGDDADPATPYHASALEPPPPPPGTTPPPYGTVPSRDPGMGAGTTGGSGYAGSRPSYGPPPGYAPPYGSPPPHHGSPPYYQAPPPGFNPHSPGYQPRPLSDQEVRTWGMIAHLSSLSGYIGVPLGHVVGPLVVLLTRGKESESVAREARHALNFNLTMLLCTLVCIPLIFVVVGFFLLPVVLLTQLVCTIIAGIAASNGQEYRYPLSIEFVK